MIPELKEGMNLIAVYGTLKRKFGNHVCMESAHWEYVKDSYVEFSKCTWSWYPMAKFEVGTDRLLKVELYNVPKEWILNHLDRLEWHPTFYTRKGVVTSDWDECTIYEIASDIQDTSEQWKEESDPEIPETYYEWDR